MPVTKPAQPIRLYGARLSGHTHRVLLLLNFLELPYEVIEVDLKAGEHKRPEFLARNPFGQVPVIEDGDTVLYDSNAILVYLASRYDDGKWLPRDPRGVAGVQRWFSLATGEILRGPGFARLVNLFGAPHNRDQAEATATALFKVLDADLRDKKFALGATPTLADVAAYAYVTCAPEGGISLEPYPGVRAWLKRIEALPHFVSMPTSKVGLLAA